MNSRGGRIAWIVLGVALLACLIYESGPSRIASDLAPHRAFARIFARGAGGFPYYTRLRARLFAPATARLYKHDYPDRQTSSDSQAMDGATKAPEPGR